LLSALVDEIAVEGQLADQRVDLPQAHRGLRVTFQITTDEAIFVDLEFQSGGARIVDTGRAVLFREGQQALNATHRAFRLPLMHASRECSNVRSGATGPRQQLYRSRRRAPGPILVPDAMAATGLTQMLAQQLTGARIEQTNEQPVPLHPHQPADPARWRAVICGLHFHTSVEMHRAFAVLVVAKRLQRQRLQQGLLFGEHRHHLTFGGAVNARVGPALLPAIEMRLRRFDAFEALPFQRRLLRVGNARFDLPFAIRIAHPAGHGDGAVMRQHVAIKRIERGVVDIRSEYAFFQVVEHHDFGGAAQPAKRSLMQLRPDARTRLEGEQPDAFAAAAEREHKHPRAPVLSGVRVASHGALAVVDLRLFPRGGLNDGARFRRLLSAQFANVAPHRLVSAAEAVHVHQFLPDGHGIAALRQRGLDELAVRLAGADGGGRSRIPGAGVGGHPGGTGRFCRRRVGGHLVGRFCRPPAPASRWPRGNPGRLQILARCLPANACGRLNPAQRLPS